MFFFSQAGPARSYGVFFFRRPARPAAWAIPFKILKEMEVGGQKAVPKMDPFGGAQMLENAMKQRVLELFGPSKGVVFGTISGPPHFRILQRFNHI